MVFHGSSSSVTEYLQVKSTKAGHPLELLPLEVSYYPARPYLSSSRVPLQCFYQFMDPAASLLTRLFLAVIFFVSLQISGLQFVLRPQLSDQSKETHWLSFGKKWLMFLFPLLHIALWLVMVTSELGLGRHFPSHFCLHQAIILWYGPLIYFNNIWITSWKQF